MGDVPPMSGSQHELGIESRLHPPRAAMPPIVLATANPHKVAELREIFAREGIDVMGLHEAAPDAPLPEPDETGGTFEGNAAIKARAYAALTGRPCLAD